MATQLKLTQSDRINAILAHHGVNSVKLGPLALKVDLTGIKATCDRTIKIVSALKRRLYTSENGQPIASSSTVAVVGGDPTKATMSRLDELPAGSPDHDPDRAWYGVFEDTAIVVITAKHADFLFSAVVTPHGDHVQITTPFERPEQPPE